MKKTLIFILTLCLLFSGIAYASTDLYVYTYNGSTSSENYLIDFNRGNGWNNGTTLHMYYLEKDGLSIPTYCCDFERYITSNTNYRRLNLEDASYFTEDEAKKIRGILNYGYWVDWTADDLAAAASASGIESLTAGQALAATQLAIWQYANFSNPDTVVTYRTNGSEELEPNVIAFMNYLLAQSSIAPTPANILFTNQIVETHAIFTENNYTVTAKFKLVSTNVTDLTLTATLGSDIQTFNMSEFKPEEDGFYKITFTNVTEPGSIKLEISGMQQTISDVYFYEPIEGRDSSQNLVGWAEDATPVNASTELEFSFGTKDFVINKVAAGTETCLEGVTFDLYAEIGSEYVLVKSGLTTDSTGKIEIKGLADEYNYYLKETSAPSGYILNDNYIALKENVTTIENNKEEVYIPTTTSRTVQKVWNDTGYEEFRPEEVKVQLYRNGEIYGEKIILTADTNWTYTWYGLSKGYTYTVQEITELENYTCEINDFTITNTYEPPELPPAEPPAEDEEPPVEPPIDSDTMEEPESASPVPKTGDNLWYWFIALVISASGLCYFFKKES